MSTTTLAIPGNEERLAFFAPLGLLPDRLAELAALPDSVIRYCAACGRPEQWEMTWRTRVNHARVAAEKLPDVIESVRKMPTKTMSDWRRIMAFLVSPVIGKRLGASGVSPACVLMAANCPPPFVAG